MSDLSYGNPPLNRPLYERLKELCGRVIIAKRGEAAVFGHELTLRDGGLRKTIDYSGEAYRVNCPFCVQTNVNDPDTKQRLWLGHLWGVFSEVTRTQNWGQAVCFHNNCLANWDNNRMLQRSVYADMNLASRAKAVPYSGEVVNTQPTVTDYPENSLPLEMLPPNHPAINYLRQRRFDPQQISREYGVRYCTSPGKEYPLAAGRLIIPIIMDGMMRMWQARYTGDIDWKRSGVPKYYNQRGTSKSSCLYGFDAARNARFVTLTEGITNVWRLGSGAVATLGKTMSYPQFQLIRTHWDAVVIALDAGTYLESEDMYTRLSDVGKRVVRVTLPDKHDPDTLGVEAFWALVADSAAAQGVAL